MTATAVPAARRRTGNALVVLGVLLALLAGLPRADALSGEFRAATPSELSVLLSQQVVPAGSAEAFLIAPDDRPEDLLGVGAALGALAGHTSLLLTPRGSLPSAVAAEVDRISNARTVAYVLGDPVLEAALRARGLDTNLVAGQDPMQLALALAQQTFGVAAGTSQRLIAVGPDQHAAGIANSLGANLGIPVVPLLADHTGEAFLRGVIVVAPEAAVPDAAVNGLPGGPVVTRLWAPTLDEVGVGAGELLAAEPKDGDLVPRAGTAVIGLDDDEPSSFPSLLAPVVAAAYALDGIDATVRLRPFGASYADIAGDGPVTVLGLTRGTAPPTPAPLPATGGGLALGGLLVAGGLALRRSRP